MKITETKIRQIIKKTLNEQSAPVDGPAYYAWKSQKLQQALSILTEVQSAESRTPAGEDPELNDVVDMLGGLLDAVDSMG
jgi:hypothetical protein